MKNLIPKRTVIFFIVLISGVALLTGCAVYTPNDIPPVTVPQIIQMSKDSVSSKNIIHEIRKSHTAYALKASEYAKLQKDGVADSVVNFMQKTHLNLVRQEQQMQDSYYFYPGYRSWWYGYPAYSWPYYNWEWNMRPSIIFRGGAYYKGGGTHRGSSGRR